MFTNIHLHNFKLFKDISIDFTDMRSNKKPKPLVLIYGDNGAGKSSIIEAFLLLCRSRNALSMSYAFDSDSNPFRGDPDFRPNSSYKFSRHIRSFRMIGAKGNTVVSFQGIVKNSAFEYEMAFDDRFLVKEKLSIDETEVFHCSYGSDEFFLNPEAILVEEFASIVNRHAQLFFGEYSYLSCLLFSLKSLQERAPRYVLSKPLRQFLHFLSSLVYDWGTDTQLRSFRHISYTNTTRLLNNLASGEYRPGDEKRKERSEKIMSEFFSALSSHIEGATYEVFPGQEEGSYRYKLFFKEKRGERRTLVPYELESTGVRKLVALFTYLIAAGRDKMTLFFDEVDTSINGEVLKTALLALTKEIKGQLIFTTNSLSLLNYSLRKYCYVIDWKGEQCEVLSLDTYGTQIQPKTDIVGRYLKGMYGGDPKIGTLSFEKINSIIGIDK